MKQYQHSIFSCNWRSCINKIFRGTSVIVRNGRQRASGGEQACDGDDVLLTDCQER